MSEEQKSKSAEAETQIEVVAKAKRRQQRDEALQQQQANQNDEQRPHNNYRMKLNESFWEGRTHCAQCSGKIPDERGVTQYFRQLLVARNQLCAVRAIRRCGWELHH